MPTIERLGGANGRRPGTHRHRAHPQLDLLNTRKEPIGATERLLDRQCRVGVNWPVLVADLADHELERRPRQVTEVGLGEGEGHEEMLH